MVDPNRKINRFTDRDIEFLEECEKEFSSRFSEEDPEFMEYCAKPLADPPIIENFSLAGSGNSGGHSYQQHRSGSHPYQQHRGGGHRGWRSRGGGEGWSDNNRNYRHRRGNRGGSHFVGDQNGYERRDQNPRRETYPSNGPPMKIRRDYSNFVAASKEE